MAELMRNEIHIYKQIIIIIMYIYMYIYIYIYSSWTFLFFLQYEL